MKKLEVIGYQPDRLCTLKDLEVFDRTWWAQKPVATLKYDYRPTKFQLTEAAKEALGKGIYYVKLLRL